MTPLLVRIERELQTSSDPRRRAELQAERACYLARTGHFAAANEITASLRAHWGAGQDALVAAWIMLVEGLTAYFERLSPSARDRLLRAQGLCRALKLQPLLALTSAWLAHMEFDRSNYAAMADLLVEAEASAAPSHHDALLRTALVLGDAYLHAGQRVRAQHWYEQARAHAMPLGDEAALGALMYNRAVFGLNRMQIEHCIDGIEVDVRRLEVIAMELDSARKYQASAHFSALSHLVDLFQARALMLGGKPEAALRLFDEAGARVEAAEQRPNRTPVAADRALCLTLAGRRDEAAALVESLAVESWAELDGDDRVLVLSSLRRAARLLGMDAAAVHFDAAWERACAEYARQHRSLVDSLARFETRAGLPH